MKIIFEIEIGEIYRVTLTQMLRDADVNDYGRAPDLFRAGRYDFVPNAQPGVALIAQMVRVRVRAGRVVLDERQPHRLVDGALEVIFARRVRRQRVPGAVQQTPVAVVKRFDEELALTRVLRVAGRLVVHEQHLWHHTYTHNGQS